MAETTVTEREIFDASTAAYDDAKQVSEDARAEAQVALRDAQQIAESLYIPTSVVWTNPDDVVPNDIVEPIMPTGDISAEVKAAFDYAFGHFNGLIEPQIISYLEEFFPDIADAVKTSSDAWIVSTIENGRYMPADVEAAIWNRGRDREVQDALRTEQGIVDSFAARGFSTPPGTMLAAVTGAREALAKQTSSMNREMTIKVFDVANENSKFAVEQAVNLRTAFVGALGDFIKTAMIQPNQAADYAKTQLAAKTGLYDSAVRLYSARIDEERMRTSVLNANKELDVRGFDLQDRGYHLSKGNQISAAQIQATTAVEAAKLLSNIAAQALATRSTVVSQGTSK